MYSSAGGDTSGRVSRLETARDALLGVEEGQGDYLGRMIHALAITPGHQLSKPFLCAVEWRIEVEVRSRS